MDIKNPTTPCICCYTTLWNINVSKQAINDKLQGSVATYWRYGGVINNQIEKGLLLSMWVKKTLKLVNIWQSYKEERGYLMHFARLANSLLKDEHSAWDSRVFSIWQSYGHESVALFFGPPCTYMYKLQS